MSVWDGGSRVPCLVRWPGRVPAGRTSDQLLTTMDLLPTFAALAGAEQSDRELDGRDASAFLLGQTATSPRDEYLYYAGCLLTGVRSGQWKLVLPRPANPRGTGWWGRLIEAVPDLQLYNLEEDPGESTDVAAQHPEVVQALMKRIERAREQLGDLDRTGAGARFYDEGPRRLQVPIVPAGSKTQYDGFKPLGSLRITFETGTLDGWTIVDGELGKPVSDAISLPRWKQKPFCREGHYHLSTVNTGRAFSDEQMAVVQSPRFVIRSELASFLTSGGFDEELLYIGLCDAETGEPLLKAGGSGGPQMHRVTWDVRAFKDRPVFLQLVDKSTDGWGHLTFDDFSADGQLAEQP